MKDDERCLAQLETSLGTNAINPDIYVAQPWSERVVEFVR